MNRKLKYRAWVPERRRLEYFELDNITVPDRVLAQSNYGIHQFICRLDKNMKEIYERDVIKCTYGLEGIEITGEVRYSCDYCAYFVGDYSFADLEIDSLEVIGNTLEDYTYDEQGNLKLREIIK